VIAAFSALLHDSTDPGESHAGRTLPYGPVNAALFRRQYKQHFSAPCV